MTANEFKVGRVILGLKQSELAGVLDVSTNTIGTYERKEGSIPKSIELAMEALLRRHDDQKKQQGSEKKKS